MLKKLDGAAIAASIKQEVADEVRPLQQRESGPAWQQYWSAM
jgi:hypothetical protein